MWKARNVNNICKQLSRQEVSASYTDITTLHNGNKLIIASTVRSHKHRTAHVPKMLAAVNHLVLLRLIKLKLTMWKVHL